LKILAVGDSIEPSLYDHFDKSKFVDIDLIISCGDLEPGYLDFLTTMLVKPLYYVRGNHDKSKLSNFIPENNIDGKIVVYDGITIAGLEGSNWYGGHGIEYKEGEMRWKVLKLGLQIKLHGGIDIIVSHAPPYGVNDLEDVCHRGFKSFLKLISQFHPRYFLHAHIHSNYSPRLKRVTVVGDTKVVNCTGLHVLEMQI
jgi:Icc-related predicted phosphoesterase